MPELQALLRNAQQLLHFRLGDFTHTKGVGAIAVKTVHQHATIHARNVALLQSPITGQAVYHLIINTDEQGGRATIQAFEARYRAIVQMNSSAIASSALSGDSGRDVACHFSQGPANKQRTLLQHATSSSLRMITVLTHDLSSHAEGLLLLIFP
jgi:hypothetical protein